MELNCPGIHEVTQQFGSQGYQVADRFITSDALTGTVVLIDVNYFSCFIEEIPNESIECHYLPHHPVYKKSTTMPLHMFSTSSKPAGDKSLNDCLLMGLTLTAKLHDILLSLREGKYVATADISKVFHRV